MPRLRTSLVVVFLILRASVKAEYEVPEVLVEALSPKGLRVSIPDEEGILLFAFHGKINEEMNGREAGRYSVDIIKSKDGRWVFLDKGVRLKAGDVIYYWVNVDYDDGDGKHSYIKDDQAFTIKELIVDDTISTSSTTTHRPSRTTPRTTTVRPTRSSTVSTTTERSTWSSSATTESTECKYTDTIVNGNRSCQGKLVFEENFRTLADKRWFPVIKFAGDPDYEFVIYQENPENLYVQKNTLHIRPILTEDKYGSGYVLQSAGLDLSDTCTGVLGSNDCKQTPRAWQILPPVISAQITTKDHFSVLYGVVEIRARLPRGDWIYPELYLKSRSDAYGHGLDSGLIRIAFTPGNTDSSRTLSGGCVCGQSVSARNYGIKTMRSDRHWTHDYHVYRVEWKTDSITVSVDDQVYGNIYPPNDGFASQAYQLAIEPETAERWRKGTLLAPFDKEMYLVLGVGVGGQCFPDRADNTKPWTNEDPKAQLHFYRQQAVWNRTWNDDSELLVDYVKIWAL